MKDENYRKDYNRYIRQYAKSRGITIGEARKHRIPVLVLEWYRLRAQEGTEKSGKM